METKTFEEKFYDKFIYDEFDTTGLCILGNRKENRPASGEEMIQFFTQQKQEMVEKVDRILKKYEDRTEAGMVTEIREEIKDQLKQNLTK